MKLYMIAKRINGEVRYWLPVMRTDGEIEDAWVPDHMALRTDSFQTADSIAMSVGGWPVMILL